jgi:hypothetical protein
VYDSRRATGLRRSEGVGTVNNVQSLLSLARSICESALCLCNPSTCGPEISVDMETRVRENKEMSMMA